MTTVAPAPSTGMSPVRRLLPWLGTEWKRLALAVLLGSLAIGCGVALLATSAWLISICSDVEVMAKRGVMTTRCRPRRCQAAISAAVSS